MPERKMELPTEIVDLTSAGWNSRQGRYFIGQTGELHLGNHMNAWGGIINPIHSGVNVYFDIFTITNFGLHSFTAEVWLNAEQPCGEVESATVTPSNQAIHPLPRPYASMVGVGYQLEELKKGVNIFDRIVPSNSTLVSDSHQGSIIIGPGGSFSIQLKTVSTQIVTAAIVLTWWEERVGRR